MFVMWRNLILAIGTGPFWPYVFWVGNCAASLTGVLALMISLYVTVYGEGLALRGPLGSMVLLPINFFVLLSRFYPLILPM